MIFCDFMIRKAKTSEYKEINSLVKRCEDRVKYRVDKIVDFIEGLREQQRFISDLELLAERKGDIIGHVMFSKGVVRANNGNSYDILLLDPISYLDTFNKNGVCKALINCGVEIGKRMGFIAVVTYGKLSQFNQFGFRPAHLWNIKQDQFDDDSLLVKELNTNSLSQVSGRLLI